MRVLNFLMPMLALMFACTEPELPDVQGKNDSD